MSTPAAAVIRLRRELHRHPEISGHEAGTAGRILKFFEAPISPAASVLQNILADCLR